MKNQYTDETKLPLTLDGLTPEWLTNALGCRFPGVEVTAVEVDGIIVGTASKARLRLEYNETGREFGLPPTMYAKGGFHGPEQLELGKIGYVRESNFFRFHAPQLEGLEIPRSYFAATDGETGQSIVLLEDLAARGVSFGNAVKPLSRDTAAATLEWMARLHGQSWNASYLAGLESWPGGVREMIDILLSPEFWGSMTSRSLADPVPAEMRDPRRVQAALTAMWNVFEKFPHTFIHGDAHLGNMYFLPDGGPAFLDWQSPMRGPWADDVSYFLIGALTVDDRRKYERELLQHYLDCLGTFKTVPLPGFDDAWLAYRQQVMHGFMWVATPPEMQPEEVVAANTERFCAAFRDLETLDALGI